MAASGDVERARVLLTVKAAPEISRSNGETVCVAGVRVDSPTPAWVRLFPVTRSWFFGNEHPKYQLVDIDFRRHDSDPRPESFRPMLESVEVVDHFKSAAARAKVLNQLPQYTMCDLVAQKGWSRASLGRVVPATVERVTCEDRANDAGYMQKQFKAAQGALFGERTSKPMEIAPFIFRYEYHCMAPGCGGHKQSIVDWELSEAWRKWRVLYPKDHLDRIAAKWMELVEPARQPAFFVGNQKNAPQGYLVLGVGRDVRPGPPEPLDRGQESARPRSNDDSEDGQPRNTAARLFDL